MLVVKFWNVTTRVFILRVGRENLQIAQTSLILMNKVEALMVCLYAVGETEKYSADVTDGYECRVRILHVGGTLEKVEQRYKTLSEAWLESSQKKLEIARDSDDEAADDSD